LSWIDTFIKNKNPEKSRKTVNYTRELIELGTIMALRPAALRDEPLITPVPKQHPAKTNNPNTTINPPIHG
jgi:hypothetical protein